MLWETGCSEKLLGVPGTPVWTVPVSPGTGAGHSGKHPPWLCQRLLPAQSHCHLTAQAGTVPPSSLCHTTTAKAAPWATLAMLPGLHCGWLLLSHQGSRGEHTAPGMPALLCRDE